MSTADRFRSAEACGVEGAHKNISPVLKQIWYGAFLLIKHSILVLRTMTRHNFMIDKILVQ